MKTFFTSDTYFWHRNVIAYCNRPFASTEGMNAEMIRRWNLHVNPEDWVFHLGDFSFGKPAQGEQICKQLNGVKILVRGNHDRWKTHQYLSMGFAEVWTEYNFEGFRLQHHPPSLDPFEDTRYLVGHVHNLWKSKWDGRVINVGVDIRNYEPKTLEELLADL